MNKEVIRIFAYFMAANTQAVILIGAAFGVITFLEEAHPQTFSWELVIWPICIFLVGHTYYLIMRKVLEIDRKRRGQGDRKF